jgi:glycosyltransferase involved in cell wall biosynthesis
LTAPLRPLFLGEGQLYARARGDAIMGPGTAERSLALGLGGLPDVEPRFVRLAPPSAAAALLARHVPLLGRADLDLQAVRWYVVNGLAARRTLRRELAREPADVVHVNSHSIAFLLRREMRRRPFFLSVDATAWEWRRMGRSRRHSRRLFAPASALERRAFRSAHTVLAWTHWALESVAAAAPDANVVELSPGIDTDRFRPAAREERARPRVLFVGGRFEEKGGPDLLAALDGLLGRDVELDVVTSAPVPESPGVRVRSLSQDDPVLVELFQQADVFCLPTHADAMGFAVQEAMACAVPVVTTNVGALEEVTAQGAAGITVEPGDRAAIRAAIVDLLGDDARRAALGAAGRDRAERRYDARRQGAELATLMREAAG